MSSVARPGVRQFRIDRCLSYVLFDQGTRQAAIIDPHLGLLDEYRGYLAENALKPLIALETCLHADHFSASHVLREEFGAAIGMSARTSSARATRKLGDRERIAVGALAIEAIETPGAAPDGLCFHCGGALFSGNSLFIGAVADCELPGADPALLWKSVHDRLAGLPPDTVIFPGHDAGDMVFSTLKAELAKNPCLLAESAEKFRALRENARLARLEREAEERLEFNRSARPGVPADLAQCVRAGIPSEGAPESSDVGTIGVEKYRHKLQEHSDQNAFVDVREPGEFSQGHMPGVTNIPLSELAFRLDELSRAKKIYISCLSGRRSQMAARTLSYLGLGNGVNVVTGGIQAWQNAGLPVEK